MTAGRWSHRSAFRSEILGPLPYPALHPQTHICEVSFSSASVTSCMAGGYVVQVQFELWCFVYRDNVVRFPGIRR